MCECMWQRTTSRLSFLGTLSPSFETGPIISPGLISEASLVSHRDLLSPFPSLALQACATVPGILVWAPGV